MRSLAPARTAATSSASRSSCDCVCAQMVKQDSPRSLSSFVGADAGRDGLAMRGGGYVSHSLDESRLRFRNAGARGARNVGAFIASPTVGRGLRSRTDGNIQIN